MEGEGISRGRFLAGTIGGGGLAAVLAAAAAPGEVLAASTATKGRSRATTRAAAGPTAASGAVTVLDLDGQRVELLGADGGNPTGVVAEDGYDATAGALRKHIAAVKYNNLRLFAGAGQTSALYDAIAGWTGSGGGTSARKSGSVVYIDRRSGEVSQADFRNAQLAEVTFPAVDAASTAPAYMTVSLAPDSTRRTPGAGARVTGRRQKQWLCSNFRLRIDGLEDACSRVTTIGAVTIGQLATGDATVGGDPGPTKLGPLRTSDLVLTLAEADAGPFYDWSEDFLVRGNNDNAHERSGTLEYLAPNGSTYFTLSLQGLGISGIGLVPQVPGTGAGLVATATLYCEAAKFTYAPTAAA